MIRNILASETSKASEQSDKAGTIIGIIGWSVISLMFWPIVAIVLLFMWVSNDELQGGRRYAAYLILLFAMAAAFAFLVS